MLGKHIKVRLPGEAPWAIVTAELEIGRVMARIDNHTVGVMHGYKYGDVATFEGSGDEWVLAPLERQEKNGPASVSGGEIQIG